MQYVDAVIEQRAERGLGEADVSEFFWFGSPRLITRLFTLVYFGNSLSLANTIFGLTGVSPRQNAHSCLLGIQKGETAAWQVGTWPASRCLGLRLIAPTALATCCFLHSGHVPYVDATAVRYELVLDARGSPHTATFCPVLRPLAPSSMRH